MQDNLDRPVPPHKLFPGVSPGFDNSPRRPSGATIITGSTPELYERWLRAAVERFEPYSAEENLVFVNAWNEWAEGNHLEPSRRWRTSISRLTREPAPESEPTARAGAMPSPQAGSAHRARASSRCTCRSSIRSPRTTSGGGRASPSGPTSPRARPLFPGHDQPKVPADLGFYDLRRPRGTSGAGRARRSARHRGLLLLALLVRRAAAARASVPGGARRAGSHGSASAWRGRTRPGPTIWTGDRSRVLIEQTYPGPDDHERHFYEVLPAFRDERYFRVDGRPLFIVYRPNELPDADAFADQWRALAAQGGAPRPVPRRRAKEWMEGE